jgi:hypothetical protein
MHLSDDENLTFDDIRQSIARGDVVYYQNSENRIFIYNGQLMISARARYPLKLHHLKDIIIIPNIQNYCKEMSY